MTFYIIDESNKAGKYEFKIQGMEIESASLGNTFNVNEKCYLC